MSDSPIKPIDDGGPAYPMEGEVYGKNGDNRWAPGMSLRDWFAGQAMAAALSNPSINLNAIDLYAIDSYDLADRMIKARGKA